MPKPRKWTVKGRVFAQHRSNPDWEPTEPPDLTSLAAALAQAGDDIPAAPVLQDFRVETWENLESPPGTQPIAKRLEAGHYIRLGHLTPTFLIVGVSPEKVPRSGARPTIHPSSGRYPGKIIFRVEHREEEFREYYTCGHCHIERECFQTIVQHQLQSHVKIIVDVDAKCDPAHPVQYDPVGQYWKIQILQGWDGSRKRYICPFCTWRTEVSEETAKAHIRRYHTKHAGAILSGSLNRQFLKEAREEIACEYIRMSAAHQQHEYPKSFIEEHGQPRYVQSKLRWTVPDQIASRLPRKYQGEPRSERLGHIDGVHTVLHWPDDFQHVPNQYGEEISPDPQ